MEGWKRGFRACVVRMHVAFGRVRRKSRRTQRTRRTRKEEVYAYLERYRVRSTLLQKKEFDIMGKLC